MNKNPVVCARASDSFSRGMNKRIVLWANVRPYRLRPRPPRKNELFHKMVQVLQEEILRVGKGTPGALGSIRALLGVIEAQTKGGLHLHASAWGRITADDITRHAATDHVRRAICAHVDSLVSGEVDPEHVVDGWGTQRTGVMKRSWYTDDRPTRAEDVTPDASLINSAVNHHGLMCGAACQPKIETATPRCRMSRPVRPMFKTKITELEIDLTEELETKVHCFAFLSTRPYRVVLPRACIRN